VAFPTTAAETFTADEARVLAPYFTNTDRPVFALTNLPETVKGALFARYSRSAKSVRRLFLDEFVGQLRDFSPPAGAAADAGRAPAGVGAERAEKLYARVLSEYGDDSVDDSPLRDAFVETMDLAFDAYARWIPPLEAHFRARYPKSPEDSDAVYRSVIRAKALDTLRGLLPAATTSNVGLFGSGQAFEALLLRMLAHPVEEVRGCAQQMLVELRRVIPAFLSRVDQPNRGGRWIDYFAETRKDFATAATPFVREAPAEPDDEVRLTEFDPEGETKVVASALYSISALPDDQLMAIARRMSADDRASLLRAYCGTRANRRHKPGRAFERTRYRFDVLADYGAFRDLQRHRLLTLEWQPLGPRHGYTEPAAIEEAGALDDWRAVMRRSADLHDRLLAAGFGDVAGYAVAMAYRVRFYMDMNAREAMHVIELRTSPQGHPSYRRVCQLMHRAIADVAGHRAIAGAMQFVDHSEVELERLQSERVLEKKRQSLVQ
jgi:thymidylate synthase ThyX